ncbi:MAG: hypothetical protein WA624_19075, partial [Methylocella sp.]
MGSRVGLFDGDFGALARGFGNFFYAGVYYFADGFQEFEPRVGQVFFGGWRDAEGVFQVIEDLVADAAFVVHVAGALMRFRLGLLICALLAHTASFISTVRMLF